MIRWFVEHGTTSILGALAVFLFGWWSYVSLPREAAPDIEIPFIIVSTPYIGVSPADVEALVTNPMEAELASLTGMKRLSSSSAEGVSVVAIEFEPEVDISEALQKVRDRVNRARPKIPEDSEEPTVTEVSFSDIPALLVTLSGIDDEELLKRVGEQLEEELTRLPGVLDAVVTGGREREIRVEVDPFRLAHYSLSMGDVVSAVAAENVNIPGGDVTVGSASVLLRTPGEFTEPVELEGVAIKRVGDRPVLISDVARVTDGFEDRKTYSRVNGRPSVTVAVKKSTGANLLTLSQNVRAHVAEREASFPPGVAALVLGDQAENVEVMVADLENNMATALLLVVAVMVAFMGLRASLFVAISIPLSMLASFLVIQALGYTLNMVVLFALILALGMLVDNAIVVVENVYRHLEMGKDRRTASIDGANEVALAVASSTATTVAAFFPMIFWSGIMGQFMGYLPKVVMIVLTASLVAAVLVVPVLTAWFIRAPKTAGALDDETLPIDPSSLSRSMGVYYRVLAFAIDRRGLTLLAGLAALVGTIVVYGVFGHGVEFFPATEPERATISVRMPEGTDLESTDRVVRAVEKILAETENLESYVAEVGVSGSGNPLEGASNASNAARLTLDFLPAADRAGPDEAPRVEPSSLTITKLRAAFAQIPGTRIEIAPEDTGPPVGAAISVEVSGDDYHLVGAAAAGLLRELENIPGTTDLDTDYRVGRPELRLRVDRSAAKRVGVSTQAIGGALRTAVAGSKASALRDGEDEYDIVVRLAPEHRDDLEKVLQLRVPGREDTSPDSFPVPLSTVASYELAGGSGTIRHVDQDLVVTIQGDVSDKSKEAEIRGQVEAFLAAWEGPPGIEVGMGGAADEQADAAAFLGWAFTLAVALVLIVLVAQFDSLAIPGIILATVVLSLVGVLWGLLITGTPFGIIMTGIGVISLAGVVVNNAIVLLDYQLQLEARGMNTRDALLRSGITRFRPVLLTAGTTILGLAPMAAGISIDVLHGSVAFGASSAQFWGPMAVAVSFGLAFATVLTLVMVPTLYALLVDVRGLIARLRGQVPVAAVAKALLLGATSLALWPASARAVSLDEAFRAAEDHSFEMRLAREQTQQAKTLRWQALSAVMPRVTLDASYVINQDEVAIDFADQFKDLFPSTGEPDPAAFAPLLTHPDSPFTLPFLTEAFAPALESLFPSVEIPEGEPIIVQPKTAFSGNLTLYQPILNGQAFPAWQGAKNVGRAAAADEGRTRQRIRGAVAQVYYGLSSARQSVEVTAAAVALARQQVDLATRQVESGTVDALVRMQAELAVSRAERDLLGARQRLVEVGTVFTRYTGLPASVELEDPPPVEVPADLDEALARAVESRQDVVAAEHRVAAARNERTGRDLEWLPSIDFTFSEVYNQVPGFVPKNFQWRAAFNLHWTLWDGGLRIARSRELASRARSAQILVEQTQQAVRDDVAVGWERYQRAVQALKAVEAEQSLAEETLARARARFEVGRANWLDVESARVSLEAAKLARVSEHANRDLAAIDLLVAVGSYDR